MQSVCLTYSCKQPDPVSPELGKALDQLLLNKRGKLDYVIRFEYQTLHSIHSSIYYGLVDPIFSYHIIHNRRYDLGLYLLQRM